MGVVTNRQKKMVFDEINRNFNYDVDVLSVNKLSDWPETGDMGEQDYVLECEGTFREKYNEDICVGHNGEYNLQNFITADYTCNNCGGIRLGLGEVGK